MIWRWLWAPYFIVLAACGPGGTPSGTPSGTHLDDDRGRSARDRGELLSLACQACHTLGEGQGHQLGPNLYGVFGRVAGTSEGFGYSPVLRAAEFVWSPAELDRWLADPAGYLPGTTMSFTGYQSAADRGALIDYLLEATGGNPP